MVGFIKKTLKFLLYGFAAIAAFVLTFTSRSYRAMMRYTLFSHSYSVSELESLLPMAHADGGFGGGHVGGNGSGASAADGGFGGDGTGADGSGGDGGDSGGDSTDGGDSDSGDGGEGGDCDGEGDG